MDVVTTFFMSMLWQGPISDPNQFNNYLVLGYVVMWIIGVVYVVSLVTRQRNVQKDVDLMLKLLRDEEDSVD